MKFDLINNKKQTLAAVMQRSAVYLTSTSIQAERMAPDSLPDMACPLLGLLDVKPLQGWAQLAVSQPSSQYERLGVWTGYGVSCVSYNISLNEVCVLSKVNKYYTESLLRSHVERLLFSIFKNQ